MFWKRSAPAGRNDEHGRRFWEGRVSREYPLMTFTRRNFAKLGLGAAFSVSSKLLFGQGVSTHSAKPLPRAAPSGRPFNAHFVDVARQAGLRETIVYGSVLTPKYIVE